ncbi:Uncharacterized protein Adt_06124 [Abeliophyllum distichum]|uniref:Uncharacterized protein n=1 Tax=Abeliophyllum distichum TaxID=126358 RepID=A0ABD1V880_9LAMI
MNKKLPRPQHIQQHGDDHEDDDGNFPMAQCLTPKAASDHSSIFYPAFDRKPGTLSSNTVTNSKEHVNAITTRSGVQLSEIHVKRLEKEEKQLIIDDEEKAKKKYAKSKEEDSNESVESSKVRASISVKAYVPPILFFRGCRSTSSTCSLKNFLKSSRNNTSTFPSLKR